ncbi:MAG TPA: hypothetical protein VFN24_14245 [Microbacterium sp.]|nr:hypothetical protein [Microbacterium sp.]
MTEHAARPGISLLRRIIVGVIIAAFGLAAVLGIIVLLGGSLGETAFRVLATTAVIGAFSVGVLCCAALVGRRAHVFGMVGVLVTVLSAALVVWNIWVDSHEQWELVFKLVWTAVAVSSAFAVASLLLLLSSRQRPAVRVGLWITLALIALLLALTLYMTWAREIPWDDFARMYGIVAILAALGAIVVPVMSLLMPDRHAAIVIPPVLAEQLAAAARARGITVEELVAPVLASPDPVVVTDETA